MTEFVLFDKAGHESYLALQPERWREVVAGFLLRSASPATDQTRQVP